MLLDKDSAVEVAAEQLIGTVPMWLRVGGAMGALIASTFRRSGPFGPLDTWPAALQSALQLCLESRMPFAIAWGRDGIQLFNDAFLSVCGTKHPGALGQRFRDCWASAWSTLGPFYERALAGQSSYVEDGRVFLDRTGGLEETFLTFDAHREQCHRQQVNEQVTY